jgi:hypothetical protein
VPKFGQSSSKELHVPPRTGRIAAWCIWIALMLKLQMKTDPVHPLKYLEISCVNRDWLSASLAKFLVGTHEGIRWCLRPKFSDGSDWARPMLPESRTVDMLFWSPAHG